jgi:RHS repeat-associated protein
MNYTPIFGSTSGDANLNIVKTTDYVGNRVYENGSLKRVLFDGGYIEGGVFYYYITDHLGNVRIVANSSGTVIQRNHYYPYGMVFAESALSAQDWQPYKYNGKELDQMHGLNLYDYSARQMEPALGRFTTMDPMCEKYYDWSPYAYVANNPIIKIDPDGMDEWEVNINGLIKRVKESEIHQLFAIDRSGNRIMDKHGNAINVTFENRDILDQLSIPHVYDDYGYSAEDAKAIKRDKRIVVTSDVSEDKMMETFKFLADNTKVEWSLEKSNKGQYGLVTSGKDDRVSSVFNNDEVAGIHSHPNYKATVRDEMGSMSGDVANFKRLNKNQQSNYVYMPNTSRGPVLYNVGNRAIFIKRIVGYKNIPKLK